MSTKIINTDFDALKADVLSYFNEDHSKIQLAITLSQQEKEIDLLKETISNERFFFVVNMLNFEIEQVHGVQRYLGYPEKEFTYKKYWNNVIHPGKQALKLLARHMYEALCSGKFPLKFMVQRFTSLVPLKHYNGHYLLTKKTSSTFQYDINNRLIAYIDEFTIIGDYNGEALSPRMYNNYGEEESLAKKEILEKMINTFIGMKIFSTSEMQIARKIAYNPHITKSKIAEELNIKTSTVDTFYKRFLSKARHFFCQDFHTLSDAAAFLKREGIL
jgi:hypothetical protein